MSVEEENQERTGSPSGYYYPPPHQVWLTSDDSNHRSHPQTAKYLNVPQMPFSQFTTSTPSLANNADENGRDPEGTISIDVVSKGGSHHPTKNAYTKSAVYADIPIDFSKLDGPKRIRVDESVKGFPDLWSTGAFLVGFIAFAIAAGFGIPEFTDNFPALNSTNSSVSFTINATGSSNVTSSTDFLSNRALSAATFSTGIGFLLSIFYISLLQKYPNNMIHGSFLVFVCLDIAITVILFLYAGMIAGIIGAAVTLFSSIIYFTVRHQIRFARVMLKTVTSVFLRYPATVLVGLVGAVVAAGFSVMWYLTVVGIVKLFQQGNFGAMIAIIILLVLYIYWLVMVIHNVVHVTISGVFALAFFHGYSNPVTENVFVPYKSPTTDALFRALTKGFGPVCLGSLLISIFQFFEFVCRLVENRNRGSRNIGGLCSCFDFLISGVKDTLLTYNTYAFVEVAIHGKGYQEAGKFTMALFKARGFAPFIYDNIIGTVLVMGAMATAIACGATGFLYAHNMSPPASVFYDRYLFSFLGGVIGFSIFTAMGSSIHAGVIATYVCLAEDPATMAKHQPALFMRIQLAYPALNWGHIPMNDEDESPNNKH